MKKALAILSLVALGAVVPSSLALAQQQAFAVIDEQRILQESNMGRKEFERIDKLQEERLGQLQQMEKEIEGMREKLRSMGFSISEAERTRMVREIEDKVRSGQRFKADAEREVKVELENVLAKLEEASKPIIEGLGQERGILIIMSKGAPGLIYADPTVDITGEVVKRLNSQGN